MPQAPAKPTSNTIDIPGIGSYELPDPNAARDASASSDISMWDAGRYATHGLTEKVPPHVMGKVGRTISSPEVMAGLSAILAPETGGMSLAIPPLVGAATSVGRDVTGLSGNDPNDTQGMTGRALTHGAVNAIPGVAGKLYESGASIVPALMHGATGGVRGVLRGLLGAMGEGLPAAKGIATEAAPVAADLGQYATAAGQKQVVQAMVALENKMNAATGPAKLTMQKQMAVLEDLNRQILSKLRADPSQAQAMAATGLPAIQTTADTTKGSIVAALRALLAGGGLLPQERP